SQPITGLSIGVTYYYCAIASNSAGTAFGTVQSFTTDAAAPSVNTVAATGTTGTTTTLGGAANPNSAATTAWFRYATTNPGTCEPATGGTALGSGNTAAPYSQAITGLTPITTYYYCAIAQNSEGTRFGQVLSFTTPTGPPTVTTLAPTSVAGDMATLNGSSN